MTADKCFFAIGAFSGGLGVVLGAFAAHVLKTKLSDEMFQVFEVAVRYHLIHSIALCLVGLAISRWQGGYFPLSGWMFGIGIVIFSGSLYILSMSGAKWLGAITPIGGLAFIAGWILLGISALRAV